MRNRLMVAAFFLLLISPLCALVAWPPWAEARARAAWRAAGLPLEEFAARHPKSSMNDSARALLRLGRDMGIHFGADLPSPAASAQEAFAAVRKDLHGHVRALLAARPSQASEALRAFRRDHTAELAEALTLLAEAPPPAWEQDAARDMAPIPPLGAVRDLTALLVLTALEPQAGDPSPDAALRAVVRLGASLRGRPELISLMMSLTLDRQGLALTRRVDAAPAALVDQLTRVDARAGLLTAMQAEAWQFQHSARAGRLGPSTRRPGGWLALGAPQPDPFFRFYARLCAADLARVLADLARRTAQAPVCSPPTDTHEQDLARLARWNALGRMALPHFRQAERLTLLHALDVELTRKVLALRRQRASEANWPAQTAEPASQVCPGTSWTYERRADAGITLAYAGPLESGEADELRFEAR